MKMMRLSAVDMLGVALAIAAAVILVTSPVQAQGVAPQLLTQYLTQTGMNWRPDASDLNVFRLSKTTGLNELLRIADEVMVPLYEKYR
jgi:hypothetical protein